MNKALFLDRDGIINIDHGYVYQKERFEFIEGIFDICLIAQQKGYKIIIITNQSGIARGYYTEKDFENITTYMCSEFQKHGIKIDDVFYCPFIEETHPDRKPNPGLILKAQKKYNLDLHKSILLGDSERDIEAGYRAGIDTTILYSSSQYSQTRATYKISKLLEIKKYLT